MGKIFPLLALAAPTLARSQRRDERFLTSVRAPAASILRQSRSPFAQSPRFSSCTARLTGRTLRARAKPPPRAQSVRVHAAESADDVCSGFVTCLTPSRCIAAASAASAVRPAHASLRAAGNEGAGSSGGLFSKIKNALGGGGKRDKPESLDGLSPPPRARQPPVIISTFH